MVSSQHLLLSHVHIPYGSLASSDSKQSCFSFAGVSIDSHFLLVVGLKKRNINNTF